MRKYLFLAVIFSISLTLLPISNNRAQAAMSKSAVIDGCIVTFSFVNEDGTAVKTAALDPKKTYYASYTIDIVKSKPSTCWYNDNVYEYGGWEVKGGKYIKFPYSCHNWSDFKESGNLRYVTNKVTKEGNVDTVSVYFRLGLAVNHTTNQRQDVFACVSNVGSVIKDYGNTALFIQAKWGNETTSSGGGIDNPVDNTAKPADKFVDVNTDVKVSNDINFDQQLGKFFNPLNYNRPEALVVWLINILLLAVGSLSVLFIIIGGIRMVSSGGNESAVTKGKNTIQWAVLGLILSVLSFTIVAIISSIIS